MTAEQVPTWWWLLGRARGTGLVARLVVVAAAVIAVGAIRLAAGAGQAGPDPALDVAVIALALVAVAVPDSHVGLALIAMIGVDWWVQVDDVSSAWSIAVAAAVAVIHAALAAATVAPPTARWTGSMIRRWTSRSCLVSGLGSATWLVLAWVEDREPAHVGWLAGPALAAAAIGALWTARGSHRASTAPRR